MLRPFDVKTPAGRRARGEAAVQRGSDSQQITPHCPGESPCYCRPGVVICITCLSWSRRIAAIDQRRADSLRRQAMGRRAAGGG